MKRYTTLVLLSTASLLVGCGKKEEEQNARTPAQTQSVKPDSGNTDKVSSSSSELPSPVLAAIDVQKILDSSTATSGIRAEIETKRTQIQTEMTKYETELREKEQKLAQESSTLSKEEFLKKREDFERRVADVQMKLNVRKLQLETAFENARSKVYEAFLTASNEVRHDIGANIVFYKEQIVVADNGFDITEKVLERLNAALPSVQIVYPDENEILKKIQSQS